MMMTEMGMCVEGDDCTGCVCDDDDDDDDDDDERLFRVVQTDVFLAPLDTTR